MPENEIAGKHKDRQTEIRSTNSRRSPIGKRRHCPKTGQPENTDRQTEIRSAKSETISNQEKEAMPENGIAGKHKDRQTEIRSTKSERNPNWEKGSKLNENWE